MFLKTTTDVDYDFQDPTPVCREYTYFQTDSGSRIYAVIPGRSMTGPLVQVHFVQFLGTIMHRNSDSIQDNPKSILLGSDLPRKESSCGLVTSQRCKTQSHEFSISFRKIHCKRKWVLFNRDGTLPHQGHSCGGVWKFRRIYWTMERHSFLQILQQRNSPGRDLNMGHKIVTSLWSRWTRHWRRSSLEFDGSKATESISEVCSAKILKTDWLQHVHEVTRCGSGVTWFK